MFSLTIVVSKIYWVLFSNKCGYLLKFEELKQHLTHHHSDVNVIGQEGRRGKVSLMSKNILNSWTGC